MTTYVGHTGTDQSECPACQQTPIAGGFASHHYRVPVETPSIYDTLDLIARGLAELITLQQRMLAALGSSSDSRSSVEVKTSTRGVDVASKAYADSSMDGLSELAVERYFATLADVQQRLNGS
jgi:hypothetical protein